MSETRLSKCGRQPFACIRGSISLLDRHNHYSMKHLARLRYVLVPLSPLTIYCVDMMEVRDAPSLGLPHRPRVFHKIAMLRALSTCARRNGSRHEEARRSRQDRAWF